MESKNDLALAAYENGMGLFKSAWQPFEDDLWVVEDIAPSLDVWIDVLVANGKLEQALIALDEADRYTAIRQANFPLLPNLRLSPLNTALTRYEVLSQMGNMQAADTEWNRLVQAVKELKSQPGFLELMREHFKSTKLPETLRAILEN